MGMENDSFSHFMLKQMSCVNEMNEFKDVGTILEHLIRI
jgi:hypothetical protein